jgi:phosphonate transport system permease protein
VPERAPVALLLGRRGALVLAGCALAVAAWLALGLSFGGLVPRGGGWRIARDLLRAAPMPALGYQGDMIAGAEPFLVRVAAAALRTLVFATAAMSLALVAGFALGFLSSSAWWSSSLDARAPRRRRGAFRRVAPVLQIGARVVAAAIRSVHELLWAVVFLAAFGLTNAAAVVALALPFAGTLAKVFSELFDEAPRSAAAALEAAGAGPVQAFCVGALPRALPDVAAYAFYRFECAIRSAAILGFFGYETLGYEIKLAFDDLHYRELWTYLYALLALVLALEAWSASLRRRFVA